MPLQPGRTTIDPWRMADRPKEDIDVVDMTPSPTHAPSIHRPATGAMRQLFGSLFLGLLLILVVTSSAQALTDTQLDRCRSLNSALDGYRSDIHGMRLLCQVAANRSIEMGRAGSLWHDLGPVKRALAAARICWRNVGEVVTWNNYSGSGTAFMTQWHSSSTHWSVLMGSRFDRGGGGWSNQGGRHWAVYYVLDLC
jgi:hypothetical protein